MRKRKRISKQEFLEAAKKVDLSINHCSVYALKLDPNANDALNSVRKETVRLLKKLKKCN